MSILKQRVPMCRDQSGNESFITVEWLKDLLAEISAASTTTTASTTTDLTALNAALAALTLRVAALEKNGYQV